MYKFNNKFNVHVKFAFRNRKHLLRQYVIIRFAWIAIRILERQIMTFLVQFVNNNIGFITYQIYY